LDDAIKEIEINKELKLNKNEIEEIIKEKVENTKDIKVKKKIEKNYFDSDEEEEEEVEKNVVAIKFKRKRKL
jgi:hypothetical protein